MFNDPERDDILINNAGILPDKALFPLIICIGRFGTPGVVELAGMVSRDYTTVSRQIKKLVTLGLAARETDKKDKRISKIQLTTDGKHILNKIDQSGQSLYQQVFADWTENELTCFTELSERFSDGISALSPAGRQTFPD